MDTPGSKYSAEPAGPDAIRAALIERLARIRPVPARIRSPKSMQPTPEAAKTRVARIQRKQRLLFKKVKRAAISRITAIPPAPDPLTP
jgi:hypothetical protein